MFARLREAWWVLRGYRLEYPGDELEKLSTVSTGPVYSVQCEQVPSDVFAVRGVRAPDKSFVVMAAKSISTGEQVEAILAPAVARQFAAGVLNAADDSDGTTPLLYAENGIVPGVRAVLELIDGTRAQGLDDARVLATVENWARQVVSAGQEDGA